MLSSRTFDTSGDKSWTDSEEWKRQAQSFMSVVPGAHTDYLAAFYGPMNASMHAEIWVHTIGAHGDNHDHSRSHGRHGDGHHAGGGHHNHGQSV